jgi:hypothetical protein
MRRKSFETLLLLLGILTASAACLAQDKGSPAPVSIQVDKGESIEFRAGKELSSRLVISPMQAKPYFWPLNAPNGKPITRAWPMDKAAPGGSTDHVHQKSAWFTYGDIIPEGVELKFKIKGIEGVDFWSEAPGHGRIVCTNVSKPSVDHNRGRVVLTNEWRTADDITLLDERRAIQFLNFGEAQLYVVDSDLSAVVPVTFGDTKEGAFGVRVADSLREEKGGKGHITNAEGKVGEKQCWGQISAWCDYSGPVEGSMAGVAIFADPNNPLPSCWHSRGYGLMAANPFGREKSGFPAMKGNSKRFHLDKGEHLKLRYGIFLHNGDVKEGKVADYYEQFVKLQK